MKLKLLKVNLNLTEPEIESKSESKIESESDWSSDDEEPWDDLNMDKDDKDEHTAHVCEWWERAKQIFKENTVVLKSRSFYMGDSKRTQQRHAQELKIAAAGSHSITDYFNVQPSSRNEPKNLESNYESADDDDDIRNDDWKNMINSIEQELKKPDLANDIKSKLGCISDT